MNKRIKKKNDGDRIFDRYLKVTIRLAQEAADTYAHLEGYEEANDIFGELVKRSIMNGISFLVLRDAEHI